jgi:hypothetical protein
MLSAEGGMMPDYNDNAVGPPSSATVIGIVVVSIVVLIASGYMIYSYSSFKPSAPAQTTTTTGR